MGELQMLGFCRWSYPAAPGAFQKDAGDTLGAIRAALYAPERLDLRLFYLEHVLIPCLEAQSDGDFTFLMLMGEGLPEPWRGRVLKLIARVPQIVPRFLPEGLPHRQVCVDEMRAARAKGITAVGEFRIDDDDAVAVDFIERCRAQFSQLRPFFEEEGKLVIDYNRGYLLRTDPGRVDVQPVVARYWNCGMVIFLPGDSDRTTLNFHHARMWMRLPMITWPRQPMFIRGVHGQNDSTVADKKHNPGQGKHDPLAVPAILRERFGIDLAALETAWMKV